MTKKLVAVLTGDIVDSRKEKPSLWLRQLKKVLKKNGTTPVDWEVFRGDMFQLRTTPEEALQVAIEIKAELKKMKNIDVRIAIGIGGQEYKAKSITESNGVAFANSGNCFENLKRKRLAIQTPCKEFDEKWNLYFRLASLTMDNWTPTTAYTFKEAIIRDEIGQKELAIKLKKTQSTISASLNRGGYDEIKSMMQRFVEQVQTLKLKI